MFNKCKTKLLIIYRLNIFLDDLNISEQSTVNESTDISLDDVDWDEPFELEEPKDLLQDIADINWNEDVFSDFTDLTVSISREDHSNEFKGNYHFSEEMLNVLKTKFGLQTFRPGQREIINAILSGHDCLALMCTGGGKSLCYQLPAVLSKGVTIVISPLIALIADQVDKLNALDIRAAHLCCTLSREEAKEILSKLYVNEPEINLLYLTPEKILVSNETRDMIDSLYKRKKLSRFVVDEVHCLSLWGHDFRPHYKQLCVLRENYNDIPIVCFTATATKQVETDIIVNLKLRNVKKFVQSFNRPNIKYQVIDKREDMPVYEIYQLIKQKFFRKSGIIYCLTRRDCVELSQHLKCMGIKAKPYHAGLEDEVREQTQREWMQDKFHVVVATIAFGMGIDKPDVRFVIHNKVPMSLEAYYQESGRAGRDGYISYSYFFYSYRDVIRVMKLMNDDLSRKDTLEWHFDNLQQMVAFANNQIDCRRYLQLLNLGENFDRQFCMQNRETICDNCENFSNNDIQTIDITEQAKELSSLVQEITKKNNVTLNMVVKIYKGSKERNILARKFNSYRYYGSGRRMNRLDVHRILRDLLKRDVLTNHYITTGGFPIVYIKPGTELHTFLDSSDGKMSIPVVNNRSIETECIETEYSLSNEMDGGMSLSANALQYLTNKIKFRCYTKLLDMCYTLGRITNASSISSILHPLAIKSISELLPGNQEELIKIQHVTIAIINKFGVQILKVVNSFREQIRSLQGETTSDTQSQDPDSARGHSRPLKRKFSETCSANNNNDVKRR